MLAVSALYNITTEEDTPLTNIRAVPVPNVTAAPFLLVAVGCVAGSGDALAPENVRETLPPDPFPNVVSVLPKLSSAVIVRVLPVPAVCVAEPVTTSLVAAPAVTLKALLVTPVSPVLLALSV